MKTWIGTALIALMGTGLSAQTEPQLLRNELKLNGFYTLVGLPEISYERIINEETSFGVSLTIGADPDLEWKGGISPYYRWFFSKKPAAGLFIESLASVYIMEDDYRNDDGVWDRRNLTGAGIGFALGYKLISDGGWVGEVYAGGGRNFSNSDDLGAGYPRLGFCIGRRFGS